MTLNQEKVALRLEVKGKDVMYIGPTMHCIYGDKAMVDYLMRNAPFEYCRIKDIHTINWPEDFETGIFINGDGEPLTKEQAQEIIDRVIDNYHYLLRLENNAGGYWTKYQIINSLAWNYLYNISPSMDERYKNGNPWY